MDTTIFSRFVYCHLVVLFPLFPGIITFCNVIFICIHRWFEVTDEVTKTFEISCKRDEGCLIKNKHINSKIKSKVNEKLKNSYFEEYFKETFENSNYSDNIIID